MIGNESFIDAKSFISVGLRGAPLWSGDREAKSVGEKTTVFERSPVFGRQLVPV